MIKLLKLGLLLLIPTFVSVGFGDFDGDNVNDVFVVESGVCNWYEATGNDNEVAFVQSLGVTDVIAIATGDADGDGNYDLLAAIASGVKWYEVSGDNTVSMSDAGFGAGVAQNGLLIANLDQDHYEDILLSKASGQLVWYESKSDNSVTTVLNVANSDAITAAVGDFDGNGSVDLFVSKTTKLDWYESTSDNAISWNLQMFDCAGTTDIEIGKVDGDSKNDLLLLAADGTVKWYEANGAGVTPRLVTTFASNIVSVSIVDVDSDGINEIYCADGSQLLIYEATADDTIALKGTAAGISGVTGLASVGFTRDNIALPVIINTTTVISDANDVNFPRIAVAENGNMRMKFSRGIHPVDEVYDIIESNDCAWSWQDAAGLAMDPFCHGLVQTVPATGPVMSAGYATWPDGVDPTIRNFWINKAWDGFSHGIRTRTKIYFPFDIESFYFHGEFILLSNGTIVAIGHGNRTGQSKHESIMIASSDKGVSWDYRGTMVEYTEGIMNPDPDMPGASESSVILLDNGDLLCVSRCGDITNPNLTITDPDADVPMYMSVSSDNGYTWSSPVSMGVAGVDPRLLKLSDGSIALSYGRPNVYLKFADKTGSNWSDPMLIYAGAGSGYTGIAETPEGDILVAYTESDFGGANDLPGDVNYLKIAKVAVNPCKSLYLSGDVNHDCQVNLGDLAELATSWTD